MSPTWAEQRPESTGGKCLQGAERCLPRAFRVRSFGGRRFSFGVRLDRWVAGRKGALLPRFGPTHRALHRQYPLQRELTGFHSHSIQHRRRQRWSVLLSNPSRITSDTCCKERDFTDLPPAPEFQCYWPFVTNIDQFCVMEGGTMAEEPTGLVMTL